MSVRRVAVLLAASFALALSGCAGNTAGSSPSTSSSATSAESAAPSTPTSAEPSAPAAGAEPPSKGPTAGGSETISGTVAAGVEPGCLILQGAGSNHLLIIADPELRSVAKIGSSITVTGRAEPGQMTTCQQGVPFIVTAVRAN